MNSISRRAFTASMVIMGLCSQRFALAKTIDPLEPIRKIAFGSCAKQWEPQPIWRTIAAQDPDLFLFLGDAIYGDWDGKEVFVPTEETLQRDWSRLGSNPDFSRFRERTPILATWDNHDYGKHDGGAEFTLKEESKRIFLDFFREPSDSERRNRPGIYDSFVAGPKGKRVQIILLDCRTFKDPYLKDERTKEEKAELGIRGQYLPNMDPNATLLGAAQWSWLEAELERPAELRLICSGVQVVANEKAMEEWENFPLERQRLFDLIGRTGANGVVFLSGNVHFAEISQTDEGPYPLIDFTASGMTHIDPGYASLRNNRRTAGPLTQENFGLIEIDWEAELGPQIVLSAIGLDGLPAIQERISLGNLSLR